MPSQSTKETKAKSALDALWAQQIIEVDEIYDKIEDFKETIEYLTITPLKNNNGV